MFSYIDSSLILSILFEETSEKLSAELWKKRKNKFTSSLTQAEIYNNLYRAHKKIHSKHRDLWFNDRKEIAKILLSEIDQKKLDDSIFEIIKSNEILNDCKTLDSLHLATALSFKFNIDESVEILSYDRNMNNVARKLGFSIGVAEKESF